MGLVRLLLCVLKMAYVFLLLVILVIIPGCWTLYIEQQIVR